MKTGQTKNFLSGEPFQWRCVSIADVKEKDLEEKGFLADP